MPYTIEGDHNAGGRRWFATRPLGVAACMLAAGLVVSGVAADQLARFNERFLARETEMVADHVRDDVMDRIGLYEYGLRGARGAVVILGADRVDRGLFRRYVATRDMDREFPGARGVGLIRRVPLDEADAFVDAARADGEPGFTIRQLAPHDGERFVILYIEPHRSNQAAVGLDVASEANRRTAALAAMRSGEARLTGPITLVQAAGEPEQSLLMLLPVYPGGATPATVAEREAAAIGWTYSPLTMREILAPLKLERYEIRLALTDVTDPADPVRFFDTEAATPRPDRPDVTMTNELFGRRWQFDFTAQPSLVAGLNLVSPRTVMLLGTAVSLLLAALAWTLAIDRLRRRELAAGQARLADIVTSTNDGIISETVDGVITSWNRAAEGIFGYRAVEAIGRRVYELIVPEALGDGQEDVSRRVLAGGAVAPYATVLRRKDGSMVDVSVAVSPIRGADGRVVGAARTVRDISREKAAEARIVELNGSLEAQVRERTAALEVALREHGALLRTINEQLLYSVTDPQGLIIEANANFCRLAGYERDELIGQPHGLLRSGVHPPEFWRAMWQTIQSGRAWHGEVCNRSRGGALHWLDTVIAPFAGPDGRIERFIALRTDITARKAAEEERARLHVLLDNIQRAASEVSIIATTVDGVITVFNTGAERLLGYGADEMIGVQTPAVIHVAEEIGARGVELTAEYGTPVEGFRVFVHKPELDGAETREWTYVRKDGSRFPVSLSVTALRDGAGRITGYLGIAVDITEPTLQRRALTEARDQLLTAAAVAELGIWSWSLDDGALLWNDRMHELYDQPVSLRDGGLNYTHWLARIHPDDLAEVEIRLNATVEDGCPFACEFRVLTPGGRLRIVQAGGQLERDGEGRPARVTGITRDVTAERTLEAELRLAKEQADAASAGKSAFLANMSHEIRTPMNAVLGMLRLVRQTELTSGQLDYVTKAQSAATSLLGLLNDILDFSKIDSGKLELDLHPFEFEELMRNLGVVLSGNQGDKPVEVLFDIDPAIPRLLIGDQLRLQQVLINLAGNALKFTAQGHVIVGMHPVQRSADRVTLRVSVSDTGIGIAPEQLSRIFDGFVQAEASTTRRFGGTGLGLVISRRLVALMGGDLHVESTLGQGSRFWFEIDLGVSDATPAAAASSGVAHLRILVVDDNALAGELLVHSLQALGCRPEVVSDGLAAVTRIRAAEAAGTRYDVVLMDWLMPGLDGMETARRIADHPVGVEPPPVVIMVTAFGRDALSNLRAAATAPFAALLSKPVTPLQLARAIERAHAGEAGDPALRVAPAPNARRLAGLRLLLVEDNAFNRQVATELLSIEGAEMHVASGGLAGVSAVVQGPHAFDAVLMDVQMPDIDGFEATRRIRADGRFTDLPILAMTANASRADRLACLAAGMNDHVGKPVDLDEVVGALLALTGKQPAEPRAENGDGRDLLDRVFGDVALARRLLAQGRPELRRLLGQLDDLVGGGDPRAIPPLLHTIKGVAANLGMTGLAARVDAAEQALADGGAPPDRPVLDELRHRLEEDGRRLAAALGMERDDETPAVVDAAAPPCWEAGWSEAFPAIHAALEAGDMGVIGRLDDVVAASSPAGRARLAELHTQVNRLDFEGAVRTLAALRAAAVVTSDVAGGE